MIPKEKSADVARALGEALGTTDIQDIQQIPTGPSPELFFRILVKGSPYLLRIMTRLNEQNDPARIFTCMQTAAQAGLAPRGLYSSTEDGVAILDWIDSVPLPMEQAMQQLPATLRKLHALPLFPKTFNYVTSHNYFIWRLRDAGLLPQFEVEEVFRRYLQICATYPRLDADLVSCHMDLKPENILYDGSRIWLSGWQAAFVNDRYFDLAIVANFGVHNEDDERIYLEKYFGQPPDAYQSSRFFLMRQVLHMLSAAVYLLLGSAGKPFPPAGDTPTFREFHDQIWAGKIDLAFVESKIAYGKVHWQQLLQNVRTPRMDEALRIVASRNSTDTPLLLPMR